MNIVNELPPEWIMDGCLSQFRVDVKNTFWTYGDTIYNPGGHELPENIIAHEETHSEQQLNFVNPDLELDERGMTCENHYSKPFGHRLDNGDFCAGPGIFPNPEDKGKDAWWKRYLTVPRFRLEQEAQAYGVEYAFYCSRVKDRNFRARFLMQKVQQLSGPLYQLSVNQIQAKAVIEVCAGTKTLKQVT